MESQKIDATPAQSSEEIEREMAATRESMSEKVAALEDQVMGTVHTAADTISNTVEAVKNIVTTGPAAVSDSVKQSVSAVSEAVKEQLNIGKHVRENPWGAMAIAATAGFLTGYFTKRSRSVASASPVTAAPMMRMPDAPTRPAEPGMFDEIWTRIRSEVSELAEQAFKTATASLRDNIKTEVPKLIDSTVHAGTEGLHNRIENHF